MTITVAPVPVSYNGNGVTTAFAVPFRAIVDTNLVVQRVNVDLSVTLLVLSTDYTVTGASLSAGTVTCLVAPAVGTRLVISTNVPATQLKDYVEGDSFPAESHEDALDKLTLLGAQTASMQARALNLPTTDVDGAGAFLGRGNKISGVADGLVATDVATVGQLTSVVVSAGNVPAPTAPNIGKWLKALTATTFGWTSILVADLSDASANARSLLQAASYAAMKVLLSLGNVDNTSDVNKPVSTAQSAAIALKLDITAYSPPFAKRNVVQYGPTDTAGVPNFLPATSVNLNLTSQNIAAGTPFVYSVPQALDALGRQLDLIVRRTTNLTWTGLTASQTNYLFVDDTGATFQTVTAPVFQSGGTIAVTSGLYTYDYLLGQWYLGNGATAAAVNRVLVGEAVAGASTITSTVAYCYRGIYAVPDTTFSQTSGAIATISHNLGTVLVRTALKLKNITTENNYTAGQVTDWQAQIVTSGSGPSNLATIQDRNTVASTTANGGGYIVLNRTTGANGTVTAANWKITGFIERAF
jgi:hypothetical protein